MRDMLTEAPGGRGDEPRSLPLVRAEHSTPGTTSRVRVRRFTPGTTPPPPSHPLELLRTEGTVERTLTQLAEELEHDGAQAAAYDVTPGPRP